MSESFEMERTMRFEAAHHLPHTPVDHKCRRVHGHSFGVKIVIRGPLRQPQGWIMDFSELAAILQSIHSELDHRLLNEIAGLENPTSEEIARWIWRRVEPLLPSGINLEAVKVRETCQASVSYRGR